MPTFPPPSFDELGLNPDLLRAVRDRGWEVPTPAQRLAVPAVLALGDGRRRRLGDEPYHSVWTEAPTGSGKTACFALPLIQILARDRRDRIARGVGEGIPGGRVASLVLCPTRELAAQIGRVFEVRADA